MYFMGGMMGIGVWGGGRLGYQRVGFEFDGGEFRGGFAGGLLTFEWKLEPIYCLISQRHINYI